MQQMFYGEYVRCIALQRGMIEPGGPTPGFFVDTLERPCYTLAVHIERTSFPFGAGNHRIRTFSRPTDHAIRVAGNCSPTTATSRPHPVS
jgi:hypothetical protein